MRFYLGTHMPAWLWNGAVDVPLFVSHTRLRTRRRPFPAASTRWALDSGSFSEVDKHGAAAFAAGSEPYVEAAYRYRDELGSVDWMAPQDWMVEPWMTDKTGLSVQEHQERTVRSVIELRQLAPDLPWAPVLQGWTVADYLACLDLYDQAGVDLRAEPIVGVGSVCRRQHTEPIVELVCELHSRGLRLHGFGVKTSGVAALLDHLTSADSMAWSFHARRDANERVKAGLPGSRFGCTHRSCSNCPTFALWWRERVLATAAAPFQRSFPLALGAVA